MKHLASLTLFIFFLTLASPAAMALPKDTYASKTGFFTVEFQSPPVVTYGTMRIGPEQLLQYEEVKLDEQLPGDAGVKHYIVRFDQSWYPPLDKEDSATYLKSMEERYTSYYKSIGGTVIDTVPKALNRVQGLEVSIELPAAKEGGEKTGIRARFFLLGHSRIQQIVIAPASAIDSASTIKFIASLRIDPSDPPAPGDIYDGWTDVPLNAEGTVGVKLPPVLAPYQRSAPKVFEQAGVRKVSTVLEDPVMKENIVFNAYLYDYGSEHISQPNFQKVIEANHVGPITKDSKQTNIAAKDIPGIIMFVPVSGVKGLSGIDTKLVKAYYVNNYFGKGYIVVLEILGSNYATRKTYLANDLLNSLNFEIQSRKDKTYTDRASPPGPAGGRIKAPKL